MAASAYRQSQTHDQVSALVGQIKLLTVDKLKNLLRLENLPVSGVKSELQIRTIACMPLLLLLPTRLLRITQSLT